MTEFIVGTVLGSTGLLFAVKGAVDGYGLIRDLFESDKGLATYALDYDVQLTQFRVWSDRVKATDEENCLINKEPREIQDIVARIIATILDTQKVVGSMFIDKYGIKAVAPPIPGKPGGPGARPAFHEHSSWIKHFRVELKKQKMANPISWVTRDREKFTEKLILLEKLNNHLEALVRPDQYDEARLVAAIASSLPQHLSSELMSQIHSITSANEAPNSLLSLTLLLKRVQEEEVDAAASRAKRIQASELELWSKPDSSTIRSNGTYAPPGALPKPILVEWKYIDASVQAKSDIVARVHALGALLSAANAAEFRRLSCYGTFDDPDYERASRGSRRIGLVYAIPKDVELEATSPLSLLRLISRKTRPPLEVRFKLAHRLASAVALLHAANWLHKSLRSDNIIFGGTSADDADLAEPYICGFQYSRPAADTSLESRPVGQPNLDIYYHPSVSQGWSKVREVYSLGIILLEVAFWRPVYSEKEYKGMTMEQISSDIIASLSGKFGRDLKGIVGSRFVNVIKCCLEGNFGVTTGNSEAERKIMSQKFWQRVVEPLAECRA
ncbi:prion-inhibition and propagation domain protein [Fusarium beomiforme]|uniref:Prion-inhibition and propagation domain protein n=1 Tax=Fusarium beomiforme TaxID=44412 RepID=A0A9P5ARF5_9HYPO|nr:prion-inhibition and propagation domain protein [Fusarium beomiforme]